MSQPEPASYDPSEASYGKPLESWRYDPDVGDFVLVQEWEVPHRKVEPATIEEPSPKNFETIGEEVRNERNGNKSRLQRIKYPWRVGGAAVDFPVIMGHRLGVDELHEFLNEFRVEVQLVGVEEPYSPNVEGGEFHMEQERNGPYQDKRTIYRAEGDYLTRESFQTDPETGLRIRTVRQIVNAVPAPTALPAGVSKSYKQLATGLWIEEVQELLDDTGVLIAGTGTYFSYEFDTRIQFTFPSYVLPFDSGDIVRTLNQQQRRTIFDMRFRTRKAFTTTIWARRVVSYHAEVPTNLRNLTLLEWRYADWRHDGVLFQVDLPNVLANETTIAAITLPNDTYFGAYNETITLPDSMRGVEIFGTTEYLALVGTEVLADVDLQRIGSRSYRMTKTYVYPE